MAANDTWFSFPKFSTGALPVGALQALDKGLAQVLSAINALSKVINLLQLFISAFGSLMAVLDAFINYVQQQVNKFADASGNAGVFVNVLVPPALLTNLQNESYWTHLQTGGFDGFLKRLSVSFYNTADKNRPIFTQDAVVGGMLFVSDGPGLADFFNAMNFFTGLFSFMDVFPFDTTPSPPRNLRATVGYIKQSDGSQKYGIRLDWDSPVLTGFTNYKLSRSLTPDGTTTEQQVWPSKLIGRTGHPEEGILYAVTTFISTGELPKAQVTEYKDETFNGGKPALVLANPINFSGTYFDYDVDLKNQTVYYYVVQSGFPALYGPLSPEVAVVSIPQNCIPPESFGTILNGPPPGSTQAVAVEMISPGVGGLGQWSSVQIKGMLPFLPLVVALINNFLDLLRGSLKTNTQAFTSFLDGIVAKFAKYQIMLEAIVNMILAIENFFTTAPKVAFLNVSPESGGVANFMGRVTKATRPSGGFSGSSGVTFGLAVVYGASSNNPLGQGAFSPEEAQAQLALITAAADLFKKLLT